MALRRERNVRGAGRDRERDEGRSEEAAEAWYTDKRVSKPPHCHYNRIDGFHIQIIDQAKHQGHTSVACNVISPANFA